MTLMQTILASRLKLTSYEPSAQRRCYRTNCCFTLWCIIGTKLHCGKIKVSDEGRQTGSSNSKITIHNTKRTRHVAWNEQHSLQTQGLLLELVSALSGQKVKSEQRSRKCNTRARELLQPCWAECSEQYLIFQMEKECVFDCSIRKKKKE